MTTASATTRARSRGMPALLLVGLYILLTFGPAFAASLIGGANAPTYWPLLARVSGIAALAMFLMQFVTSGRYETISGRIGLDRSMSFHRTAAYGAVLMTAVHISAFLLRGNPVWSLDVIWDRFRRLSRRSGHADWRHRHRAGTGACAHRHPVAARTAALPGLARVARRAGAGRRRLRPAPFDHQRPLFQRPLRQHGRLPFGLHRPCRPRHGLFGASIPRLPAGLSRCRDPRPVAFDHRTGNRRATAVPLPLRCGPVRLDDLGRPPHHHRQPVLHRLLAK